MKFQKLTVSYIKCNFGGPVTKCIKRTTVHGKLNKEDAFVFLAIKFHNQKLFLFAISPYLLSESQMLNHQ